jgi:hypothetical protein
MDRRSGLFGSLLTTFVLSLLVGIGLPLYMNFEYSPGWKKLFLFGLIGFGGFWVISLAGVALIALISGRSKR